MYRTLGFSGVGNMFHSVNYQKTFIGQELDYFISMLYSVYIPAIGSNRANGIINKRGEIICLL